MNFKGAIQKWGFWLGVVAMSSTTITMFTSPYDKYKEYQRVQDSIRIAEDKILIHDEVEIYVKNFEVVVHLLDSMNHRLQGELDSLKAKGKSSKAIGLRQADGRFTYRDEFGDVHQAFKETITSPDGSMRVRFKYTHFRTGITFYLFNRYYYL